MHLSYKFLHNKDEDRSICLVVEIIIITNNPQHWLIQECARNMPPPHGSISFIFMHFSAKILPNNRILAEIQGLAPPFGKSCIRYCRYSSSQECKKKQQHKRRRVLFFMISTWCQNVFGNLLLPVYIECKVINVLHTSLQNK